MATKLLSIKEIVAPIVGGYWGETVEDGAGNARVVRNGDILESGDLSLKVPVRKLTDKEISKSKLRHGDILITMSGNVGRVALVRKEKHDDGNPYVASNFVKILRTNGDILPKYLFFLLRSPQFQNELVKYTRGVAIQNLSVKAFEHNFIPAIPKEEQEKIIALFEEVEDLRHKRNEADQKMATLISALFNKMFGDPDTWKSNWDVKPLRDVIEIASGATPTTTVEAFWSTVGTPWVSAKDMKMDFITDSEDHITKEALSHGRIKLIPIGSVLIVVRGMILAHTLPISLSTVELTINQDLKALIPKEIDGIFLWSSLRSIRGQLLNRVKTAAHGTKKLDTDDLLRVEVPVPDQKLQRQFSERVREIQSLTSYQQASKVGIEELFSSLLSKSLS